MLPDGRPRRQLGERIDASTAVAALFVVGCVLVTSRTRVRVAYAV